MSEVVETHPIYPFVAICNGVTVGTQPDDWFILIEGPNNYAPCCYPDKKSAYKGVDEVVYSSYKNFQFARQRIQEALKSNNLQLALHMSERLGYYRGVNKSQKQFLKKVKMAMAVLHN